MNSFCNDETSYVRNMRRRYATFSLNNMPIAKRAYLIGDKPPNFPMPAIPMQIEYVADGWPALVETYEGMDNGRYYIGHATIFHLGDDQELANW